MVQDIVVGTLTTLSAIVSPFGPSSENANVAYRYNLKATPQIEKFCSRKAGNLEMPKNGLVLRAEKAADAYFTLSVAPPSCLNTDADEAEKGEGLKINLPMELVDSEILDRLQEGYSYVTVGLPSYRDPGQKVRTKITKIKTEKNMHQIRIEWIPESLSKPEHSPILIWMGRTPGAFAGVQGYSAHSGLQWRRIRMNYISPKIGSIQIEGELTEVSKAQTSENL